MFGELAVLYLFLGGAGAGCLAVASIVDLAVLREPFGQAGYLPGPASDPLGRTVDIAFVVGFVAVASGAACLAFDLGRVDRIASLFANPSPTLLTFGSYALAALIALGAGLSIVRFAYVPAIPRGIVAAAEAATIVVGAGVALYTGLLFATIGGVRFWATPLVPALFFLSSASSGIALVVVAGVGEQADCAMRSTMRCLAASDAALLCAEAACAAALIVSAAASDHPGVAKSFEILTAGTYADAWWIGFIACGLVVPLVAEAAYLASSRKRAAASFGGAVRAVLVGAAAFALVGALCLRASIAGAGAHRDIELESGAVSADALSEPRDARDSAALSVVPGHAAGLEAGLAEEGNGAPL